MTIRWIDLLRPSLESPKRHSENVEYSPLAILAVVDEFVEMLHTLPWVRARLTRHEGSGPSTVSLSLRPPTRWDCQVLAEKLVIRERLIYTSDEVQLLTPAEMAVYLTRSVLNKDAYHHASGTFPFLEEEDTLLTRGGECLSISSSDRQRAVRALEAGADWFDLEGRLLRPGAPPVVQERMVAEFVGLEVEVETLRRAGAQSLLRVYRSTKNVVPTAANALARAVDALCVRPVDTQPSGRP